MTQTQPGALFGYGPGPHIPIARSARLLEEAVQADRDGLDLITVTDHPYNGSRLEAYGTIGVILGRTRSITAVATVTNLPVRPAPLLARTLTTLSALSGGRIVLGIGAGYLWDDIARFGVPRLTPGEAVRAFEEGITLIKSLAGGGSEPVTFEGEFYQVQGLDPAPVPVPPVWTGSVGPRSLAVTGRHADGWSPPHASDWLSTLYRESRPLIDEAAAAAGRSPSEIGDYYNVRGRITADPLPSTRDEDGALVGGSPKQWVEELTAAVLEHGAAGFVFFDGDDPRSDHTLGRWTQEVVPAVREAIAKG
ncbi:LLM class flavin-dependent oxidoreductase [Actinomadura macrotermitis]|uniref:F420-dependent glucose-6-phosphate dehydrogenase n=1 Tax=Actinomadura macrotermitis TaxID=2585200 RepID=A0A7K0BYN6_9ACTN|nr:LLM class flavin-dependent oxidoreductase [Actinomadura macrotermitis]MQY06297.1 F420-dependent glucose-6-phosphate dehydrogenase [Actinomadura macrotermitis]